MPASGTLTFLKAGPILNSNLQLGFICYWRGDDETSQGPAQADCDRACGLISEMSKPGTVL